MQTNNNQTISTEEADRIVRYVATTRTGRVWLEGTSLMLRWAGDTRAADAGTVEDPEAVERLVQSIQGVR